MKMVCKNCDPKLSKPGRIIMTTSDLDHCEFCGDLIQTDVAVSEWDSYFLNLCRTVSTKSSCLSRRIGALLVRDRSIISTGYNGPPRGIPHCGRERFFKDRVLNKYAEKMDKQDRIADPREFDTECPRHVLGYLSGTHMELCPAQHAEENAVSNAARNGVSVLGCTLYMNSVIPCQKCYGTLINAGITEIVIEDAKVYDKWTTFLIDNSDIKIREFKI